MQVANGYERRMFNGGFGIVTGLDAEEGTLAASLEGRAVGYNLGELGG